MICVVWMEDGLTWHKRFVLSPDEYDDPSIVFYTLRILAPEGTETRDEHRRAAMRRHQYPQLALNEQPIYLGTVLNYNVITGKLWPEIIWSANVVRWHRFDKQRCPAIELDPYMSYNWAQARDQTELTYQFGDEWWLPYSAGNWLHGSIRAHGISDLEELRTAPEFQHYARYPSFKTWEKFFEETRHSRSFAAVARTRAWRLVYAEPSKDRAVLTTKPLKVGGDQLEINAEVRPGGQIRVELRDESNRAIPGRKLEQCDPFRGDEFAHTVSWRDGSGPPRLSGQTVRVHFELHHARLYALRFRP